MVENPIVGQKFGSFYTHSFMYFHTISLVDYLALWNGFKTKITLYVKKKS